MMCLASATMSAKGLNTRVRLRNGTAPAPCVVVGEANEKLT